MQATPTPPARELVLVGGGHAHALVLRAFARRPVPGARLTVVNPGPTVPYSGMLPGHVAGHYGRAEIEIDLARLARLAGARLISGAVDSISPEARVATLPGHPPVAYDLLSLNIGATSDMTGLPGFVEHALPAKPAGPFADRWQAFCAGSGPARIAIIGGGIAGVELALAAAHRLSTLGRAHRIAVIDRGMILARGAAAARRGLAAALDAAQVRRLEHASIDRLSAGCVHLADGNTVPADLIVGAAGVAPQAWLGKCGLAHEGGYLAVDDRLRSLSHPTIYGAGDCVHLTHAPRPKAGVFAVRAARVLAHNLRADLAGGTHRRFVPRRGFLKLVSLGRKEALAEMSGLVLSGPRMWRWKDRIDRRFMDRFADLP